MEIADRRAPEVERVDAEAASAFCGEEGDDIGG
jgi:hypothetical protein